ncbi:hypothetical protein AX774_g4120 [Zancudomyces culisetae]|uniref:Uncharacterized protein n=1 Tax=Zancudomyces culisetae TaxID=1213189 RepID=A0A1R1PN51_ZANCU|nr:hypothetical protein AX774_g4120 [Zancudomyces culisetae]|eukprot:OMH82395.1 hypothetical protein AX774_g4120 [Zancudomyces culisetae]
MVNDVDDHKLVLNLVENSSKNRQIRYMQALKSGKKIMTKLNEKLHSSSRGYESDTNKSFNSSPANKTLSSGKLENMPSKSFGYKSYTTDYDEFFKYAKGNEDENHSSKYESGVTRGKSRDVYDASKDESHYDVNQPSLIYRNISNFDARDAPKKERNYVLAFMQHVNELLFKKYFNDELLSYEIRCRVTKRIQEATRRSTPGYLEDIAYLVADACKSTKLNLDLVAKWKLNELVKVDQPSVIDHIFMINVNLMLYDAKYPLHCTKKRCCNPLCCLLHTERVTEFEKAKAFRRMINMVLNEAIRCRIIGKEEKTQIRSRLVKSHIDVDERIAVIKEIAILTMLGQTERYFALAQQSLLSIGSKWINLNDIEDQNLDQECSLDPEKVYAKAIVVNNNQYLSSILNVRRLKLDLSDSEIEHLYTLWKKIVPRANALISNVSSHQSYGAESEVSTGGVKLTLPMLLHVLVHCSEQDLQLVFLDNPKRSDPEYIENRISEIEDSSLQAVQSLGLAWSLCDNPSPDLRLLCMALLLDVGAAFYRLIYKIPPPASKLISLDTIEIGNVEDGLFSAWFEICTSIAKHESLKSTSNSRITSLLLTYICSSSDRLLLQKDDFNPELHLTLLLDLITEFRKRRPNYSAVIVNPNVYRVIQSTNSHDPEKPTRERPGRKDTNIYSMLSTEDVTQFELDRATKENFGSEFDRIYTLIDKVLPTSNRIRSLLRPVSHRGYANNPHLTINTINSSNGNNVVDSGASVSLQQSGFNKSSSRVGPSISRSEASATLGMEYPTHGLDARTVVMSRTISDRLSQTSTDQSLAEQNYGNNSRLGEASLVAAEHNYETSTVEMNSKFSKTRYDTYTQIPNSQLFSEEKYSGNNKPMNIYTESISSYRGGHSQFGTTSSTQIDITNKQKNEPTKLNLGGTGLDRGSSNSTSFNEAAMMVVELSETMRSKLDVH